MSINMLNKISIIISILFFQYNLIYSQSGAKSDDLQLNTITTALPFMSITPDSRSGGMGDVGTALSATSNSIYWNTSMLNFSEKKFCQSKKTYIFALPINEIGCSFK